MKCRFQSFMPRISTSMLRPFAVTCLVAVTSLGWTGWAAAAACSSTDYNLSSQAEVDALGATGCDSIAGSLTLDLDYVDNITNVDALINITSIGGSLTIGLNNSITNLNGLSNLTKVEDNLTIFENNALANLDGLANLTRVGGDLFVGDNDPLISLDGLAGISVLGGSLKP